MRDAFGSTFMFKLIIIFLVFYVSFMTIAVSYAKVFRIKNEVINILEQYQFDSNNLSEWNNIVNGKVDPYLSSFGYKYTNNAAISKICNDKHGRLSDNGVCIVRNDLGRSGRSVYYNVIVYLVISFPIFSQDFVIPITGETTTINFSQV